MRIPDFVEELLKTGRQAVTLGLVLCLVLVAPLRADEFESASRLFDAKNYRDAFPIFLRLAESGNPNAQGILARMYGNGWGTDKSDTKAYLWATRGAQSNDPVSQYVIGYIYWNGLAGFKKDLVKAVEWTQRASQGGYERAFCQLPRLLSEASESAKYQDQMAVWIEEARLRPSPCANVTRAEALIWGLYGEKKDHSKAAALLETATLQGEGLRLAGWLFAFGNKSIRDKVRAERFLSAAAADDSEPWESAYATYYLADSLLFGEGAIEIDKERGYLLLKKLRDTDFKYFALELESKIYGAGVDRPRNTQKSILTALYGMQLEVEDDPDSGTIAGRYIIENSLLLDAGLPTHMDLAWYRFYTSPSDAQGLYREYRSKFSAEEIDKAERITFSDLLKSTIAFFENRRAEYGPIEAADLYWESMAQFDGGRGVINEPLAQVLAEEALRLAIRAKSEGLQSRIRNFLGVIFYNAANQNIRNPRLANVHLYDGRNSPSGPRNILWLDYKGLIQLSSDEVASFRKRYFDEEGAPHRTESLPIPSAREKGSPREMARFLASHFVSGDHELASEIGYVTQSFSSTREDYEEALRWFTLGKSDEEAKRMRLIIDGKFVTDMPNLSGTVQQLFEVDLVESRGGLLTDLKSAIPPPRAAISERSVSNLSLHALVIGNGSYKGRPLKNSRNDARAISEKLRQFGFRVTEGIDLSRKSFRDLLIKFSEQAKTADVTVFFYAGHGMQLGGVNYLLPVDIDFGSSRDIVTFDGINLNDVKNRNLPGSTRLIFLDACRNNPYDGNTRGTQGVGLAPMNVGTGTLISFATRDGSVALDGVGGINSPYTQALLKHIGSDEDVEIMLRAVGDEVMRLTKNQQQPWKYGALSGQKVVISELGRRLRK
jgi:TPR repeat protein